MLSIAQTLQDGPPIRQEGGEGYFSRAFSTGGAGGVMRSRFSAAAVRNLREVGRRLGQR
jgi:hypothetical protein